MTAEPVRARIRIDAPPERVWEFFTHPEAMIRWMGEYAVLAPRPGGEFTVNIKGAPVRGRYLELDPPHRLVMSWGYAGSEELPPGASTVEIRLVRDGTGTRVHLEHRDLPAPERPRYAEGWTRYLARLAAAGINDADPDSAMQPACVPPDHVCCRHPGHQLPAS
ncbi:MAG: SRPBCC domain-containing protein [Actinomycetota bacterium]|nr:SRPBCC domain-containing protein [Actinomycetota bacterium]